MLRSFIALALGLWLVPASSVYAAPEALPTVVLQRVAIPGTDRQMGLGIATFPPYAVKPRHEATGPEVIYVLSGQLTITMPGKAPIRLRAGDSFTIPANAIHTTTAGPSGAKVLATWAWTPGKRFNIPMPEGN